MISARRACCAVLVAGLAVLAALPEAARGQDGCGASYTVQPGDTLAAIAARCGTTVEALMAVNARIEDPARISVGWELTVPDARASLGPESEVRAPARGEAAKAALAAGTYEVRPGDSFASIATTLRVPMRDLMTANEDVDPFALRPGMTLQLPAAEPGDGARRPNDRAADTADGRAARTAVQPVGATDEHETSAGLGQDARSEAAAAGPLMLQGQVLSGPECPVLRTPEGDLYSLVSAEYGFTPGDYVEIEAEPVDLSFCTKGRATVRVTSMAAVPAPRGG